MRIGAEMTGRRVVLRSILPGETGPTGGPALTDVVGRVLSVDGPVVLVERRDGATTEVDLRRVVNAKIVPDGPDRVRPRPAMDVDPDDLSRICTRGWPPSESQMLGDWQLRAAGGFTGRANSAAVHGEPGLGVTEALDEVTRFYRERDLPPRAQVIEASGWDRRFAAAGWTSIGGTRDHAVVQVVDLAEARLAQGQPDGRVRTSDEPSPAWLGLLERGTDFPQADLMHVLAGPATVGFLHLGDPVTAIARVVVTGEWAGLSCLHVAEPSRRQGVARTLVDASLRWASDHGADKAYLQTMRHNTAALALYAHYGFREHHTYRYLSPS